MTNRQPTVWLLGALLLALSAAGAPPGSDDWKFDVLHCKRGKSFQGLVVEDVPDHILMKCVSRKPGAPTVVITELFARDEVDHVDLLGAADRSRLRSRLAELARERGQFAARLRAVEKGREASVESIVMTVAPWPADPRQQSLVYQSTYFRLVSTARPEVVQLAAVELEQVFAAYVRAIPPRKTTAETTTVLLLPSLTEYQALVRERGYNLLNPAFYDAGRNQVVCASDLQRLVDENERVRGEHDRQRAGIKTAETELRKAYRDRVPPEQLQPLQDSLRQMQTKEERNTAALDLSRRRLFQRLYHEAFHAYLATCVFPPAECEVPRWLNEGLAQIFETAIVEAGELRVGHADREHYDALRAALKSGDLLPVADLLKSGPKQFIVAHAATHQGSDRHYLASWALAFYLTFERRVIGTSALEDYVHALHRGVAPVTAFQELVGARLPRFEQEFAAYLGRLRIDGTAAAAKR